MRSNKFNIHWQVVRVNARAIKDVSAKVAFVIDWYNTNQNVHNYDRVSNWLKMTSYAYEDKSAFTSIEVSNNMNDIDNNLSSVSKEDLRMVFKDLSKRKYGFQYKSVPVAHTEFMLELEKHV